MNNEILLSKKKLFFHFEQTQTKSQDLLEYKLISLPETFFFDIQLKTEEIGCYV